MDGGDRSATAGSTPSKTAKWRSRVSTNPFDADSLASSDRSILDVEDQQQYQQQSEEEKDDESQWKDSAVFLQEASQKDDFASAFGGGSVSFVHGNGKENLAPSRRNIHIYERHGATAIATTPRSKAAVRSANVRPPRAPITPSKYADSASSEQFSVLGKRQHDVIGYRRATTPTKSPLRGGVVSRRSVDIDPAEDDDQSEFSHVTGRVTMVVNDFNSVPHLGFGKVPISDRKTLQLTLQNPSNLGNARIKYEGYSLIQNQRQPSEKPRFKCDLHVCVVPAESSVLLRITFEPLDEDLERGLTGIMRFTVNDRYKLQCKVTGYGVARAHKKSRFRGQGAFAHPATRPQRASTDQVLEISAKPDKVIVEENVGKQLLAREKISLRDVSVRTGSKRRESVVLDMTPPRRPRVKRLRVEQPIGDDAVSKQLDLNPSNVAPGNSSFVGSWWSQRKIVYDENWMVKQEEGFTKWMNYVLVDSNTQRFMEEEELQAEMPNGHMVTRANGHKSRQVKRRFDFSSLRILAQKRIENSWTRSANEIYHSSTMDDILFDLQEEIARKKLVFRQDRPVYADVGLQEELIALLNNYHPVWLRLGLEAVLGQKVMKNERCTLRSMFTSAAKKSAKPSKMPRALRRIILQHLVHDTHVAKKFRLVKNLKTPIDGSLGVSDAGNGRPARNHFVNKKKNITGREYFDALMDSFILKFLMLIKFLDSAIESRADKFMHFPCLFRISTTVPGKKAEENDSANAEKKIKCSQEMVTDFCRFFLSSEGRIDKHLKQLGYVLKHQQTPLDEIDVQIKNLAVDLRDGVRLAKLMEALTSQSNQAITTSLSSYLRVPALSRLQKVHNVEICLHFLQEKCGQDVLESIKTATNVTVNAAKKSGRLSSMSSSGFASIQNQVDERLVEKIAKDIVDGHREKTLALLWKLISCFQLQSLVDTDVIQREIDYIQQRMSFRALEFLERQQKNAPCRGSGGDESPEDQVYAVLLEWCRVVCANYFVPVEDFTVSFADGKALCYLLHYYHPMLLSKTDILPTTSDRVGDMEQLLANERQHFMTVNERVKQLGEIPVLVPQHYHSNNPPEEKMVVTFICYLQSRLMDSSREIHAASRLKRWWMSPWIRTQMRIKKNRSARIIQRFWFTSSQKRLAIRQCRRLLRAAHVVKSVIMMWSVRVQFTRLRDAATVLQRAFRLKQLQSSDSMQKWKKAAIIIQYHWRKYVDAKIAKQKMEVEAARMRIARRLRMKSSCSKIENCWIQHLQRRTARQYRQKLIQEHNVGSAKIQRCWRQSRARQVARHLRKAVWKYEHESASIIQTKWRKYHRQVVLFRRIHMKMCAEKVKCALKLNVKKRKVERAVALDRFQKLLHEKEMDRKRQQLKRRVESRAAVRIQAAYHAYSFSKVKRAAAVIIQSAVRCFFQRKKFQYQCGRIVQLQQNIRIWRRNSQVKALLYFGRLLVVYQQRKREREGRAAIQIQSAFRGFAQVKRFQHKLSCVVQLQRNFRIVRRQRHVQALIRFYEMLITYQHMQEDERDHQLLMNHAATRIQAKFRSFMQRKLFDYKLNQIVKLQRNVRSWRRNQQIKALFRFNRMLVAYQRTKSERLDALRWRMTNRAVRVIQTGFRSFVYFKRASAATRIQACARGWCLRRQRFNFYAMKAQLSRLRVFAACWKIELWYGKRMAMHQKRTTDAKKIAGSWSSYKLRCTIAARVSERREERLRTNQQMGAFTIQHWWIRLSVKWQDRRMAAQEKERREEIAVEQVRRQAELAVIEARRQTEVAAEKNRRQAELAAAKLQRKKEVASFEARCQAEIAAAEAKCEKEAAAEESRRQAEIAVVEAHRKEEAAAQEALRQVKLAAAEVRQKKEAAATEARRQEEIAATEFRRQEKLREFEAAGAQRKVEAAAEEDRRQANLAAAETQRKKEATAKEARRQADTAAVEIRRQEKLREIAIAEAQRRKEVEAQEARRQAEFEAAEARRQKVLRTREKAKLVISTCVLRRVVVPNRTERTFMSSVQRVQAWWRGMLVRLHHSTVAVTSQRKKLSSMTLVTSEPLPASSKELVQPEEPLTLGARLEMALHLLLYGKRLQEMLFAGHTIEVCTKYSRECCRRCVKLGIPKTIFAAIRGLNRSRPHVELLHQLLLVLENLTTYQLWDRSNALPGVRLGKTSESVMEDVRAIEALVDLMHIHRDMQQIFALAAKVLKFYVTEMRLHKRAFERHESAMESWRDSEKRLRGLHELLEKKVAVFAAVSIAAKHLSTPSKATASFASRMNPKVGMAILSQVLKIE